MRLISIIIPCYNAAATISATINCFEYELKSSQFEIIVVNDGSMDNTVSVIEQLQQSYDNIILISKKNGGVSSARNEGLKYATGDYIWFFDADDLLFENVGNEINKIIVQEKPDILRFNSVTVDKRTKHIENFNNIKTYGFTFNGFYHEFLISNIVNFSCWSIIVKRKILIDNGINFDTTLSISEDVMWNFKLAEITTKSYYTKFCYINLNVVKYIVRDGSTVNTTNPSRNLRQMTSLLAYNKALENLKANNYNPYLKLSIDNYLEKSRQQLATKFFSCRLDRRENKRLAYIIAEALQYDSQNKICRLFLSIYRNNLIVTFTQWIYRELFLKHIKPYIGRN